MGFYVAATCVSSMFSSHKMIKIFGVMALAAFIISYLFYKMFFISVWCFFAAIMSIIIYGYFNYKNIEGVTQNKLNHAI
jgi:uncharacterized protein YqhQ